MTHQYRSLLTSGGIVLFGSMVVNALNYLFNLVISRLLSPAQFGEVATLFGLLTIISVPSTVLITLIAKYTAHYHANQRFQHIAILYQELRRYAIGGGVGLLILFLLLNPLLARTLHIEPVSFFLFSLAIPLTLIAALNTGTLQGLQRFVAYSLANIISTAVKIGAGLLLIILGYQVAGVMAALLISIAITFIYGQIIVHHQFAAHRREQATEATVEPLNVKQEFIRLGTVIFLASLLTSVLNNIDIVMAKLFLPSLAAGLYSGLSVMGRIINYGATAIVAVMFPLVSAAHATNHTQAVRLLLGSLAAVSLVSLPLLLAFALFPRLLLHLLVGSKYDAIAPVLALYGLAMFAFTLSWVWIQYFLARGYQLFLYPLTAVVLALLAGTSIWHSSITQLTIVYLVCNLSLAVAMAAVFLAEQWRFSRPALAAIQPEMTTNNPNQTP